MPLDRSKLHKGFQTYLTNAEASSGMTYEDFASILAQSRLSKHAELRAHLMEKTALGHGHANAIVAIWLQVNKAPTPAKKAPAKKTAAKKK